MDDDGRAYVDRIDNGVGMGEAELRGVFPHAGSRLAEQPDFLRETIGFPTWKSCFLTRFATSLGGGEGVGRGPLVLSTAYYG
ncbi:hypothetical protein [Nocardiopsis sp. JB363]|uniref:hypothetical protein n=1 Tax=Nocardiopsis sp. JB363 TaxID=1434837 RepID=UPI000B3576EC|nr:hypothetical protein [Nocardiopsis sp. JB363]